MSPAKTPRHFNNAVETDRNIRDFLRMLVLHADHSDAVRATFQELLDNWERRKKDKCAT